MLGMGITAESLEELGGKPVTVWHWIARAAVPGLPSLGEDYEFRLSADSMTDWPATKHLFSRRLKDSLQWVLDWCQDLAFTKTLDLPVFLKISLIPLTFLFQ